MNLRKLISDRLRAPARQADELRRLRQEVTELRASAKQTEQALAILLRFDRYLADIRRIGEGVQLALTQDTLLEVEEFHRDCVLDIETTLHTLADRRMSFARFGDGEFRAMLNLDYDLRFQDNSAEMQRSLRDVLTLNGYDRDALMLGFPMVYRTPHWQKVWSDVWPRLSPLLDRDAVYGCAHASRPIAFRRHGRDAVRLWRNIWDGRDVCVITGEGSRFTMHPDLFASVRSADFIYSTPKNAYVDVGRLVDVAAGRDHDLFLISLGPAGTILAAELARRGQWAMDIGHLSASYEQVMEGAVSPEHRN